ncbi:MAG TPA: hypothetical protein VHI54_07210, partial [Actinomycetota bacterium]|nr:hypothetical protein [Actinomycetota bacterium]
MRNAMKGLAWALGGIAVAMTLTFSAYVVAGRDLSTPTDLVPAGAPLAPREVVSSPRPENTPSPADGNQRSTEPPPGSNSSNSGSGSTNSGSSSSGSGSDSSGSGSDSSGSGSGSS